MVYGYIYKITNLINGKVYIGQAIDVMTRWKGHIYASKTATKGIDSAIRKYGAENFTVVTICSYESKQDLDDAEKHFIAVYRQFYGRKGCYNIADGGQGVGDHKGENNPMYRKHHTEATKKKQSEAKKGDKNPNKNGYSRKGKKHTEETKAKQSAAMKGKLVGEKNYLYGRTGDKHPRSRKVNQYDLQGNFIRTWSCIKEVEEELGIKSSNISACCRGKLSKAGGFIWKYKDL